MTLRLHNGSALGTVRAALKLTRCLAALFLTAALAARAQTADEFFNGGAQLYISNNIPAALTNTENGLKLYPDNVKLQKLEQLLKQQRQSQSQQNQQQQQQNQNQQSQNKQSQENQKQAQQNQSQQKQNSQSPQQKSEQQQNQQDQKAQQQSKAAREKSGQEKEQGMAMTPEEAKKLLDSRKGDEQFLQLKPGQKSPEENQPLKDW